MELDAQPESIQLEPFFVTPRCPFEILSSILLVCVEYYYETRRQLPESTSARRERLEKKATPPQAFTIVCRSWRDVTLRTPRLWATFRIGDIVSYDDLCRSDQGNIEHHLLALLRWLGRSGVAPLTMSLEVPPRQLQGRTPTETILRAIYPLLCEYSTRWYDMDLYWICVSSPRVPTPPLVLPKLLRLRCHFNSAISGPLHSHDSNLDFSTAPNLQEVMIDTLTMSLVDFILPWAQLCSLAFHSENATTDHRLYVADCLKVLSHCVNLTDLKIFGADSFPYYYRSSHRLVGYEPAKTEVVTLPRLQHLKVTTKDPRMIFGVLPFLFLPSLTTLKVHAIDSDNFLSVVRPIVAAHLHLRMLQVASPIMPSMDSILRALVGFPNIVSLITDKKELLRDLQLHYDPTSGQLTSGLVPDLQELCLYSAQISMNHKFVRDDLVNFVSSRWRRPDLVRLGETGKSVIPPFRRIRLHGFVREDGRDVVRECLREFVDEGLELEFHNHDSMDLAVWKTAGCRWPCEV
ncbi:uncharacterized protein STEHIDRAFT_135232 [Stereum hirsutum FP-91666 SS1]|uniref:F-box domain-containing protein n=1 Tax=Stereum hirsutum (strain FP-91666) TaxID=721885 RepID=R7S176_STEHR|nr:uncharacterized protein STEHIDRAFT_135232 [Stereum hirsutum FP-91666 SS1]EIM80317.1 hypothetical protein STEHIDRAFT_135232 [Stereum hirsutum FP-91666 SS1]